MRCKIFWLLGRKYLQTKINPLIWDKKFFKISLKSVGLRTTVLTPMPWVVWGLWGWGWYCLDAAEILGAVRGLGGGKGQLSFCDQSLMSGDLKLLPLWMSQEAEPLIPSAALLYHLSRNDSEIGQHIVCCSIPLALED